MAIALRPVLWPSLMRIYYHYHFSALPASGNHSHARPSSPPPPRHHHATTSPPPRHHHATTSPPPRRFAYPIGHNTSTSGTKYGQTRLNTGFAASHYMNYVQSAQISPTFPLKKDAHHARQEAGGRGCVTWRAFFL